jgi:hypothetical protein
VGDAWLCVWQLEPLPRHVKALAKTVDHVFPDSECHPPDGTLARMHVHTRTLSTDVRKQNLSTHSFFVVDDVCCSSLDKKRQVL